MKSYTPGTAHRRSGVFPYVEIWTQPYFWWLVARMYHWYESCTEPMMLRISDRLQRNHKGDLEYVPLTSRRDIRCDHLSRKKRNTLAIVYMTKEQYDIVTEVASKKEEPRHEMKNPIVPPVSDGGVEVDEHVH